MTLAGNMDQELFLLFNSLKGKSDNEIKYYLLSLRGNWSLEIIEETIHKFIVANDCSSECIHKILIEWFNVNGYHLIANNKVPKLQKQRIKIHLLSIINSLKAKLENTQTIQHMLEFAIIRNSRMNKIAEYPNYSSTLNDNLRSRFKNVTKKIISFKLVDFPAEMIGKLLTHIFSDLLSVVVHTEFDNCSWMKSDRSIAPTIFAVVDFYNFLCSKLSTEILEPVDERIRASYIGNAIDLAYYSLKLNNFDLISAIIVVLNSGPISRLKKTWDLIPKKKMNLFESLNEIVTPLSNYINYRTKVAQLMDENQTFTPILAVILKDLASNDVKPSYIQNETEKVRNLDKLLTFGKILMPIYQLQANLPSISDRKLSHSTENREIIKNLIKYVPLSDDCLLHLSYEREQPKDLSLMLELANETDSQSSSFTSLSLSEKTKILRLSAMKNPSNWNTNDVRVNLEAWGFPVELCDSLANEIGNGDALLKFIPTKKSIPIIGYRKLFQRKAKELAHYQLLLNTYGLPTSPTEVKDWCSEEVVLWLKNTEYFKYETNFVTVTGAQLLSLNENDLFKLGVCALGHRKGLLREINKLKPGHMSLAPSSRASTLNHRTRSNSNVAYPLSYVHSF